MSKVLRLWNLYYYAGRRSAVTPSGECWSDFGAPNPLPSNEAVTCDICGASIVTGWTNGRLYVGNRHVYTYPWKYGPLS